MPNSRSKGHRYERFIRDQYAKHYPKARRGYQARDGKDEPDVACTPMWIECKHYKNLGLAARAYAQAAADTDGRLPVAHVHGDRTQHLVVLGLYNWMEIVGKLQQLARLENAASYGQEKEPV